MRDSYERFLDTVNIAPADLFRFGIDEIIAVPVNRATDEWESLKRRVISNEAVIIRSFGRQGSNSRLFQELYEAVFGNENVVIDKTNNAAPTKLLRDFTGFAKTKKNGCEQLRNYQISHVFGRTKNPFAFTAPWNIVYLPKIIDPFTGHEAKGSLSDEFQIQFRTHIYNMFEPLIEDFNSIVTDNNLLSLIGAFIDTIEPADQQARLRTAVNDEFRPITAKTA
ncbi:MAG: hypothetical protein P8M30_13340 [Planctomycetaceae bacterium]|jgi:hypothetical protein|nr:hypothetical protein [Planctomycetaceae bacterium]MDG2390291.1 hypothetical protein [Planctomycetaceae bacterium]